MVALGVMIRKMYAAKREKVYGINHVDGKIASFQKNPYFKLHNRPEYLSSTKRYSSNFHLCLSIIK